MVLPLKNVVYDVIKSEKNTTDDELIKLLKKQNIITFRNNEFNFGQMDREKFKKN